MTDDWLAPVCATLGVATPATPHRETPEAVLWARSGAMELTGRADGPPLLAPGAPAAAAQRDLDVVELCLDRAMPDVRVLGERAAVAGLHRRAPWSAGGRFRALRAREGWLGLSLARPADLDLVPALIEAEADNDLWAAIATWLVTRKVGEAAERAQLLGLPAAVIEPGVPCIRPGVCASRGGLRRRERDVPLVVDLSSLWAGPLAAHLLGLGGARIVKVESPGRPDGARYGPAQFFDLLHAGHESAVLDLDDPLLAALLRAADVVIESARPRALRQAGIEAEEYVVRGTIWVSITAYGRSDAHARRVGFGDDVAAGAGLVVFDDGEPLPVGDALADPLAGLAATAAAAVALTGTHGCLLDVSMHDVAAAAARPADALQARVIPAADGWVVATGDWTELVAAPRCRGAHGNAVELGRDTVALRAEFDRT